MSDYNALIDQLMHCADTQDDMRLRIGEIACLLWWPGGDVTLKRAAQDVNMEYKTLAEYRRVVDYYQGQSARAELSIGCSVARELMDEFPVLRWSHLRLAKGIDRDDWTAALEALGHAVELAMTVREFARYVAKEKLRRGHIPKRHVFSKAGYTITITDSRGGRDHRVVRTREDT